MKLKPISKWLILIVILDFLLGVGIGYVVELYQRQLYCPDNSSCIVFGSFKQVAMISIIYIVTTNLLWIFFKFRNKLISGAYILLTAAFLYCLFLLSNMYLQLTPSYLEVHDISNIYRLTKFSERVNYEDIIAFQYRYSGSSGGVARSRGGTCQKQVLAELKNGFFNLSSYGFGQGQQIMEIIRRHKDIRINKSVGYEYRSCYDRYER